MGRHLVSSEEMSGNAGGLNGSTQHSARTRFPLKTKARALARLDRRNVTLAKFCLSTAKETVLQKK